MQKLACATAGCMSTHTHTHTSPTLACKKLPNGAHETHRHTLLPRRDTWLADTARGMDTMADTQTSSSTIVVRYVNMKECTCRHAPRPCILLCGDEARKQHSRQLRPWPVHTCLMYRCAGTGVGAQFEHCVCVCVLRVGPWDQHRCAVMRNSYDMVPCTEAPATTPNAGTCKLHVTTDPPLPAKLRNAATTAAAALQFRIAVGQSVKADRPTANSSATPAKVFIKRQVTHIGRQSHAAHRAHACSRSLGVSLLC